MNGNLPPRVLDLPCPSTREALLEMPSSKRKLSALSGALLERGALTGIEAKKVLEGAKAKTDYRGKG